MGILPGSRGPRGAIKFKLPLMASIEPMPVLMVRLDWGVSFDGSPSEPP